MSDSDVCCTFTSNKKQENNYCKIKQNDKWKRKKVNNKQSK